MQIHRYVYGYVHCDLDGRALNRLHTGGLQDTKGHALHEILMGPEVGGELEYWTQRPLGKKLSAYQLDLCQKLVCIYKYSKTSLADHHYRATTPLFRSLYLGHK